MGIIFLMPIFFVSCNDIIEEQYPSSNTNITFSIDDLVPETTTRTNVDPSNGFAITWAKDDILGIFPYEGYQQPFLIPADQVGKKSATYDGGYWALKDGFTYNAYYPFDKVNFDSAEMKTKIPVSYLGQYQNGISCNVGPFDYSYSDWTESSGGNVHFSFHHIGAFLVFNLEYPVTAKFDKFTLQADSDIFPVEGTYDLTAESVDFIPDEQSLENSISVDLIDHQGTAGETGHIYMAMPPIADLSGCEIKVILRSEGGTEYLYSLDRPYSTIMGAKYYIRNLQRESFALLEGFVFPLFIENYYAENESLTKFEFVTNSGVTSDDYLDSDNGNGLLAYFVENGETLQMHTSADKFVLNEFSDALFCISDEYNTITDINFADNVDTSPVTSMAYMFSMASNLVSLDLRCFNTENVTSMYYMFNECSSLESADLSSFNTSNVEDMCGMFGYCTSLKSLDLSNFNTESVYDMCGMFDECNSLESVDLSSFNTYAVTDMRLMFSNCSSLAELDLSKFSTSNVIDMKEMFMGCVKLKELDLTGFTFNEDTEYDDMFKDLGKDAENKPISVYVTAAGKQILDNAPTGINPDYAELVVVE